MFNTFSTLLRITARAGMMIALVASTARAQDFKVIVNAANSSTSMSTDEVARIFLKQSTKLATGVAAAPVDLAKGSTVRAAFSKTVLGRPVPAIESYWQQQIFSGKDVPPATKAGDDEVIAFVKANPGGIGYVSAGAAVSGVKVVELK